MDNSFFELTDSFPFIAKLSNEIGMPICILDTETTGFLSKTVGIVEFGSIQVDKDGAIDWQCVRIHPGSNIPHAASKIHGIYDQDVAGREDFSSIADHILKIFGSHVISGFNTKTFDIPVIQSNFVRHGYGDVMPSHHLDVRDVWRKLTGSASGKLGEVAERYKVEAGAAHNALGDALTTARVMEAMIELHGLNEVKGLLITPASNARKVATLAASPADKVKQAILAVIERAGRLCPDDSRLVAGRLGVFPSTVSFQISYMLSSGELLPAQVEDIEQQKIIAQFIYGAISELGDDRLKPIKEYLDAKSRQSIDYVQLKIAMSRIKSEQQGAWQPGPEGRLESATQAKCASECELLISVSQDQKTTGSSMRLK
jgi:DNA polymerase-3 subunit epsilon